MFITLVLICEFKACIQLLTTPLELLLTAKYGKVIWFLNVYTTCVVLRPTREVFILVKMLLVRNSSLCAAFSKDSLSYEPQPDPRF